MKALFALAATYAVFVFDTSVAPQLFRTGLRPHVLLAALVGMVWQSESRSGLLMAAIWGLIADGLSQPPLGINAIVYVCAAAVVQSLRSRVPGSPLRIGLTTGLLAFVVPIVSAVVHLTIDRTELDIKSICLSAAAPACSTAVLSVGCFVLWHLARGRPIGASDNPVAQFSNHWRMLSE